MKKNILVVLSVLLIFTLIGCSTNTEKEKQKQKVERVSKEELEQMYIEPGKYMDKEVELYLQVYGTFIRENDKRYIHGVADPENIEKNTILIIEETEDNKSIIDDINDRDIIRVVGIVEGKRDSVVTGGGLYKTPEIFVTSIEKTDYANAFAPAIKTIENKLEQEQKGVKFKIEKIELAENETRVYIELSNNTDDILVYYNYNTIMVQGDRQYEVAQRYNPNYTEPQSRIQPGVVTDGIVLFPKIDSEIKNIKLILEVRSEDFSQRFEPFTFEVNWD